MRSGAPPTLWWIRRDLRLRDNPALRAAVHGGGQVLPLFVIDPALMSRAGDVRAAWLMASLAVLDADLREYGGPGLSVVRGDPVREVAKAARAVQAAEVHIAADFAPYGRRRDRAVEAALADHDVALVRTGSPYAVAPGTLRNQSDEPYQVFSPFHRAWMEHGVRDPAPRLQLGRVDWLTVDRRVRIDADPALVEQAGEGPARRQWARWLSGGGARAYADHHDLPGTDATSHISIALRWGHLHPRTVLADLAREPSEGANAIARQIAWRDFFADVLYQRPDAVSQPIKADFTRMPVDEPDRTAQVAERLQAWQQGRTGYPLVDAGMRQLLREGWMHNRVRLVTASFLIKDLHIGWWHGAAWFMERLRDGDIAQNQLNWQWVAGCGSDAAPFFRVFNPTGQAKKFDPDGTYIRRHVAELADVDDVYLHEPWTAPGGPPQGYPPPIVDHAAERREALDRFDSIRKSG